MANKINEITRQKIKDKSAFGLPDSPRDAKLSASDVKRALYSPVVDDTNSVVSEVNRITDEVNSEITVLQNNQVALNNVFEASGKNGYTKDYINQYLYPTLVPIRTRPIAANENPKYQKIFEIISNAEWYSGVIYFDIIDANKCNGKNSDIAQMAVYYWNSPPKSFAQVYFVSGNRDYLDDFYVCFNTAYALNGKCEIYHKSTGTQDEVAILCRAVSDRANFSPTSINIFKNSALVDDLPTYEKKQSFREIVRYATPSSAASLNLVNNSNFMINQQGQAVYEVTTNTAITNLMDGWIMWGGYTKVEPQLSGGCYITYTGTTFGNIMCPLTYPSEYLDGKVVTLVGKIDGVVYSKTVTLSRDMGGAGTINVPNFGSVKVYYSSSQRYFAGVVPILAFAGKRVFVEWIAVYEGNMPIEYSPPNYSEELAKSMTERNALIMEDTRSVNNSPVWYKTHKPKSVCTELKAPSVIGLTGVSDRFIQLVTYTRWGTDATDLAPFQMALTNSDIYTRTGNDTASSDTWGPWSNIGGLKARLSGTTLYLRNDGSDA